MGMAADPATGGYWEVASDGGIFGFGSPFLGSAGGLHLASAIVGMAAGATAGGTGRWRPTVACLPKVTHRSLVRWVVTC